MIKPASNHQKSISVIVFAICFLTCKFPVYAQLILNKDLDYKNLQGPVKSIKQFSYRTERENQGVVKGSRKSISSIEDRDQYILYNKQGNYLERIFYADVDKGYEIPEDIDFKRKYSYKKGKNTSNFEYNGSGEIVNQWIYSYDSSGFCTQGIRYDAAGKRLSRYIFKYNDLKLFEESCLYDSSDRIRLREIYTYTSDGRFLTGSVFSQDTLRVYWKFSDVERIMFHEWYGPGSKIENRTVYTYDDKGNETEIISYDGENEISGKINNEYIYDKQSNWIRKIIFENDQSAYVIEREIEYYK